MPTVVYKGANRISDDALIGKSIEDLKKDDIIVEALNLDGHESIRVNGVSQSASYVIRQNDAVEFYKAQGTKGAPDEEEPGTPDDDDDDNDDGDVEVEEEEGDEDEDDEEEEDDSSSEDPKE